MPVNAVAENVLGTIGTILWTVQLIPQVWKSYKTKSTEGLSPWLVFLWGLSGAFLGVYVVVQNLNIPLILQPQLFGILCMISWAQCQYYGNKRPLSTCLLAFATMVVVLGGFEAGMVYAVRPAFRAGNMAPVRFFGIFSSITISSALLPQYYEIYKHKEVVGISILFILVDCLGGVFSDLSLAFKSKFDVIAGVAYTLVVLMDAVVIVLALILNPLAKRRRERLAVNEHSSSENGAEANTVEAQATAGSTNDTNPPDIESGEPTRVSTPLSEKQCTQQVEKPENHDSILPPRLP